MKSSWLLSVLSLATSISAQKARMTTPPPPNPIPTTIATTAAPTATPTVPFDRPLEALEPQRRAFEVLQILNKRVASDCPSGYNPCSTLDNPKVCCRDGSRCARDEADNIACCPSGASCTGSLLASTTDTSSFRFPQYGTAAATADDETAHGALATGSTMPGAYPFVYVPTTFADAKTCSAYYTRCETDYSSCTASLGNGGNAQQWGVTGAAGVTVQGGAAAQETGSTCSKLQLEACHGLNLGYCDSYHDGKQNENVGFTSGSRPRDLAFGLVVAVAGVLV